MRHVLLLSEALFQQIKNLELEWDNKYHDDFTSEFTRLNEARMCVTAHIKHRAFVTVPIRNVKPRKKRTRFVGIDNNFRFY